MINCLRPTAHSLWMVLRLRQAFFQVQPYLLNPECMPKLVTEIRTAFASGNYFNMSTVSDLTYMGAVLPRQCGFSVAIFVAWHLLKAAPSGRFIPGKYDCRLRYVRSWSFFLQLRPAPVTSSRGDAFLMHWRSSEMRSRKLSRL